MKLFEQMETERLILRKPRRDDASAIFSTYANDPAVTRYVTWRPHTDEDETRLIIDFMLKLWDKGEVYSYVITLKESGLPIGTLALHPETFKFAIGYALARAYWGKGYMTEAALSATNWLLEQPGIYRVFATCDIENPASARVMEKIGMQREGVLRRYIVHPNVSPEPRDCYMYAIVK
jgi:[ribosomal protein S5]-alanine N-acetyltransferase